MLLHNLNIIEIRKDALKSMMEGKKWIFIVIYYMIPIVVSGVLIKYSYYIGNGVLGNLISGICLLSGLMFSLLFVITNNFNSRKSQIVSKDEEDIRYIENYRNFANKLISIISYFVVKSIIIILLLIIESSYYDYLNEKINILYKAIWFLSYLLFYQYIIQLIYILKNMYAMLYDDVNRK